MKIMGLILKMVFLYVVIGMGVALTIIIFMSAADKDWKTLCIFAFGVLLGSLVSDFRYDQFLQKYIKENKDHHYFV